MQFKEKKKRKLDLYSLTGFFIELILNKGAKSNEKQQRKLNLGSVKDNFC